MCKKRCPSYVNRFNFLISNILGENENSISVNEQDDQHLWQVRIKYLAILVSG